jgi:hypothetical protein
MHQLTNLPIDQLNLVTQLVATRRAVLVWKKGIAVGVGFIRPETGLMNQTPYNKLLISGRHKVCPYLYLTTLFFFFFFLFFFPQLYAPRCTLVLLTTLRYSSLYTRYSILFLKFSLVGVF